MNITLDLSVDETAILQKQADENNAQPNRARPSTPESVILDELQPFADSVLANLKVKFAGVDAQTIIAATSDPDAVSAMKAALDGFKSKMAAIKA